MIHRDIKPVNIIIEKGTRQAKLMDFGIAKHRTGEILGTPEFIAPEQATGQNEAIDARIDVDALGAVLYFLLAARPPFQMAVAQINNVFEDAVRQENDKFVRLYAMAQQREKEREEDDQADRLLTVEAVEELDGLIRTLDPLLERLDRDDSPDIKSSVLADLAAK